MKKIFPLFLILICLISLFSFNSNSNLSYALENGKYGTIIASRCTVYSQADFNSDKILINNEEIFYLKHGEEVDILEVNSDFAKISKDNIEGYVYKYYITQNSSQIVYPVFNGSIRKDTIVYDMDFKESGYTLNKGDRVFAYKSYNDKEEYAAVQVILEDGNLYNGYIHTKDLDPDGFSGLLITAISIIVAAVTIILAIVFIKKKKKK